jgi:murein DD-endopeptidase MepM/ murein hydrolase activator NlpD
MWKNGWLYSPNSWHHAIDYVRNDLNTFQVVAAAAGKVVYIGWDNWSGNTVIISHNAGGKTDVYRTIYMHLRNGALNDCNLAWTNTVPSNVWGKPADKTNYQNYLTATGCPLFGNRNPLSGQWGTNAQTISVWVGKQVIAGESLAWAGSTGPGGCGCVDGSTNVNTHLHIFFAHRDPLDSQWYFFDPYGIYAYPSCYPTAVNAVINTECSRYPVSWKNGNPGYV